MIGLNAAIFFKWTQPLSHREGVNLMAERGKLQKKERRIVAFCSGPRVDKQHPGNWSVNMVSD